MTLTRSNVQDLLRLVGIVNIGTLAEVAVRGGKTGSDARGVYDDKLYSITGTEFKVWAHNTNPSASYKPGLAELMPGLWTYVKGDHNITRPARRHPAFRQHGNFVVKRDGVGTDTGFFAINHHRGGIGGTSSLGCQTNHPEVWRDYQPWAYKALGANVTTKKYLLIRAEQVEKILGGSHVPRLRADGTLWLAEKGKAGDAPVEKPAPSRLWVVQAADGTAYPGVVKTLAGRPSVRTRLATRWLDAFDPRDLEKTLSLEDETLKLAGNRIDEWTFDENGDTWAPIREIAEAAGFQVTASATDGIATVLQKN